MRHYFHDIIYNTVNVMGMSMDADAGLPCNLFKYSHRH